VPQTALDLDHICRNYGPVVAVDDVSLTVAKGEFVTLLGPSGSGKTSTLRLIGGFENIDAGAIRINGARVDHLPPYLRDTATIFQSGALFPHKTVAENVAFGLRMRRVSKADIRARVAEALAVVRLQGLEDRYPDQLSGGQKQRVALARSMAVRPAILLFDEPLSALDLSLRLQLRSEIKRLHDEIGFSAIYVTHDQGEAMAMSDRVAVMQRGRIEQIDRPEIVFNAAANEFIHTFVGETCCLTFRMDGGRAVDPATGTLDLHLAQPLPDGAYRLYLRPSQPSLGQAAQAMPNRVTARLGFVEFLGEKYRHHLMAGPCEIVVDQPGALAAEPGADVLIGWDSSAMRIFQ
jgi:ABC-type Fe3+/spermidine/putrescine transport system ATPase subunit